MAQDKFMEHLESGLFNIGIIGHTQINEYVEYKKTAEIELATLRKKTEEQQKELEEINNKSSIEIKELTERTFCESPQSSRCFSTR